MNRGAMSRPTRKVRVLMRFEIVAAGRAPVSDGIEVSFRDDETEAEVLAAVERAVRELRRQAGEGVAELLGERV